MKGYLPCVGLLVFAGSFTFVMVPDEHQAVVPSFTQPVSSLPTVVIDPGHGGNDDGCKGHGLLEKHVCLDVGLRLEKMLKSYNFPTVLTRRDDRYVSLSDRVAQANKHEEALFVSIHFNSATMGSISGVETFYAHEKVPQEADWMWMGFFSKAAASTPPDRGETLAGFIQAALVMKLDSANRGIKTKCLYVVRHTRMPAVLVEGGFLSNAMEAQLLTNADYRDRLAAAVAEGIVSYQRTRPRGAVPSLAGANPSSKY